MFLAADARIPGVRSSIWQKQVGADNAAELFRTDKMAELINALREVAELIILDSPPCARANSKPSAP